MRQYDKNKNGVLDRDEVSQMPERLRQADRNGDAIITLDELSAHLLDFSQRRGGGGGPGAGGGKGGNPPRSYRFLTARERLPEGLPPWFLDDDVNQDGQVSMAEYSKDWSDTVVEKFVSYDLNNDGIITPAECLAVLKAQKK